jgi:hypothetical protein
MARIRWVNESEASGEVGRVYGEWMAANPGRTEIPGILKCMSLHPDLLRGVIDTSDRVHFADGHLTRRVKEMIATYVSALNRCPY